ncbi:TPA: hypothetical protein LQA16_002303 [Enterococcus faecium]|nr:hypothetical protein [Enterococcus faecium]
MGTSFIDRVIVQVKEERKITMKYNSLDHKRMWVEKLEEDLEQLELLGYNKTSAVYKEGLKRTKKVQKELATLESSVQKKEVELTHAYL